MRYIKVYKYELNNIFTPISMQHKTRTWIMKTKFIVIICNTYYGIFPLDIYITIFCVFPPEIHVKILFFLMKKKYIKIYFH